MKKSQFAVYNLQFKKEAFYILYAALSISLFSSCTHNGFHKTDTGLEYKIYSTGNGPKAKIGDYVTMYLVYKSSSDSILFDSHAAGAPWHFQLKEPPFKGSYEEGLTMMSAGDSAWFLVSADSMYTKVFNKSLPPGLTTGSKLKFSIQMLNVEAPENAKTAMQERAAERKKMEQPAIDHYLKEHQITTAPSPDGLYIIKDLESTGVSPNRSSTCVVEYTGRFLDGKEFESSAHEGHPIEFKIGDNQVIRGWEEAVLLMKTGEKATVIIPSALAYGAEGRHNPGHGDTDVQPYTPLVYELTLRAVK